MESRCGKCERKKERRVAKVIKVKERDRIAKKGSKVAPKENFVGGGAQFLTFQNFEN